MEGRVVLVCLLVLAFADNFLVTGNAIMNTTKQPSSTGSSTVIEEIKNTFGGKWKAYKGENIDNFLKENGVNLVARTAAAKATPTMTITVEGDTIRVKIETMIKTVDESLKLDTETARKNDDGKDIKSVMTYADGKITVVNTPVDTKLTPVTVTRELVNGELVQTMTRNGVVAKRFFKKA